MKYLSIIFLILFSFLSVAKSEDIREFEIEGISLGDSVLDHSKLENYKKSNPYVSQKISGGYKNIYSDNYDALQFSYIKKDKKKIEIITGKKYFHNFKECLEMKKKIEFQVSKLFKNTTEQPVEKAHSADPSGKSFIYATNFNFSQGHIIQVSCTDWEKYKDRNGRMRNDQDELKISIALNTYVNWVRNEAYK